MFPKLHLLLLNKTCWYVFLELMHNFDLIGILSVLV